MVQSRPLFVYFRPFLIIISIIQVEKSKTVCLGFEPREAVWQVQTIPPTAKIVMSKELFQLDSNLRPLESKTVSVTSLDDF